MRANIHGSSARLHSALCKTRVGLHCSCPRLQPLTALLRGLFRLPSSARRAPDSGQTPQAGASRTDRGASRQRDCAEDFQIAFAQVESLLRRFHDQSLMTGSRWRSGGIVQQLGPHRETPRLHPQSPSNLTQPRPAFLPSRSLAATPSPPSASPLPIARLAPLLLAPQSHRRPFIPPEHQLRSGCSLQSIHNVSRFPPACRAAQTPSPPQEPSSPTLFPFHLVELFPL
jgi:hypothetical protein